MVDSTYKIDGKIYKSIEYVKHVSQSNIALNQYVNSTGYMMSYILNYLSEWPPKPTVAELCIYLQWARKGKRFPTCRNHLLSRSIQREANIKLWWAYLRQELARCDETLWRLLGSFKFLLNILLERDLTCLLIDIRNHDFDRSCLTQWGYLTISGTRIDGIENRLHWNANLSYIYKAEQRSVDGEASIERQHHLNTKSTNVGIPRFYQIFLSQAPSLGAFSERWVMTLVSHVGQTSRRSKSVLAFDRREAVRKIKYRYQDVRVSQTMPHTVKRCDICREVFSLHI